MNDTGSPVGPSLFTLLISRLWPRPPVSEAKRQIRRRIQEVQDFAAEVERLMAALPAPAPEDVQAMIQGALPWTPEAHMLALLREVRSHLLEVCGLVDQQGRHSPSSLLHRWHTRGDVDPSLLRSLRHLAMDRQG